jgi:polar amino acid transport system substrate-binding protein
MSSGEVTTLMPHPDLGSTRVGWLVILAAAALLGFTPATVLAQPGDHPADKPMQVGTDFGIAPFVFRSAAGPEGFSVDMIREVARRIKRPGVEIADMNMSGLISALMSRRIEMMVNPFGITAERSERMLFTEPYLGTGNAFIVRKSDEMKGLPDLKGRILAVNRGTISDTWATENASKHGFEVQRYDNFPDSVQAVITRRAFAALNEIPTANFAATQNPQIKVGFAEYTGRNFGYALRLESVAFRNQVDEAIECMKLDGWLMKNYEKWFRQPPPDDPALKTVFPGYGPPGFKGHDATPHTPKCS